MADVSRRTFCGALATASLVRLGGGDALAQDATPTNPANPPVPISFGYDDVVKRARDLATVAFDATTPALPDFVSKLDNAAWQDIRFRPEKALLADSNGPFRLQLFHLGSFFKRPVTIDTIRDGIVTPIPYSAGLFDYGRNKLDKPLPVNLGFGGFRLHTPLNNPDVYDEVIAFLGASFFRFLGRGQRYGLSARALAIGAGTNAEEFPFFREFWIATPQPGADRATVFALVDSPSLTGAYRFELYPGQNTYVDVTGTLYPRQAIQRLGLAPLSSMFFTGENDKRPVDDFRPEMHDSDGLLIASGTGERIWRPLRNPAQPEISAFLDKDIRGFGLLQRDRAFDHYQDLDLDFERRPTYWVEPRGDWGEGRIELVELPTGSELSDNIVACWIPREAPEAGKAITFGYKITALTASDRLSPGGWTVNTFRSQAKLPGTAEAPAPGTERFVVDFTGGDLAYFIPAPGEVQAVPTTTNGRILRSSVEPNRHTQGFRATIDVELAAGQATDMRLFLKAGNRALTETWIYPWKAE